MSICNIPKTALNTNAEEIFTPTRGLRAIPVKEYFTVFIRGMRPGHQTHVTRTLILLKGDTAGWGEFIKSFAANKPPQHPQALPSTKVLRNKPSS